MTKKQITEAIDQAYCDAIKALWHTFYHALIVAKNAKQRPEAYERLKAGLAIAKEAYNTALKAL
jgi:hypothetical protein